MNKKYIVQLTPYQRARLEQLTRTGTPARSGQLRARILLKADTAADGPAWADAAIAVALDVRVSTVERVRRLFVTHGPEAALWRRPTTRVSWRKLDGV